MEHRLPWGPALRGVRWGSGPHTVLFLHEPGADLDAWGALPRALAHALPVRCVAVDLPGHGLSDDPWEPERLPDLIGWLVDGERSGGRTIIVAAGDSALAALDLAPAVAPAGLICFSPTSPAAGWTPSRSPGTPKLFFAGSSAEDDLETSRRLAGSCGGWSAVTSIPVSARGSALLETEWGGRIVEQVVGFVRDCVYPQAVGAGVKRRWG